MNDRERNDIIISWVTISLAFGFLLSRISIFSPLGRGEIPFTEAFVISLFAVGAGFVLHELAHRYMAIRYGCHAEFRMWSMGLVIALAAAFFIGFIFAAPGAVYIYGRYVSLKQNGIISAAGPATNILIGVFALSLLLAFNPAGIIFNILFYTFWINFILAMFNLLPIFILDGSKVFKWSPVVWAAMFFPTLFVIMTVGF